MHTTLDKFGIAKGSALDMAALFGDMGTAMGQTPEQAAKMSTSLVGLAGDLASFKNIGIDQAQDALKGIFTGEGESLKSLGVIMQDSTLKEYALSQGITKKYEEMTQSEKVQLRYNYVMDMTKNAQGDFARTSDGTANSTRVLGESLKEMSATFGEVLLPIITPIIQKITDLVKWLGSLDTGTKTIILVVAGIVAAAGPLLMIVGSIATGIGALTALFAPLTVATAASTATTTAATAAQTGLNTAMFANPIGIVIAAIVALIAIGVLLYKNWDTIKEACSNAWENIKSTISGAVDKIKSIFNIIIDFIKNNWQALLLMIVNPFAGAFKLLYDNCEVFRTFVNGFIDSVVGFFKELPGKVWNAIIGIKDKFANLQSELITWANNNLPSFISKFVVFMLELPNKMVDIGKNIVQGLWNGITAAVGWLQDKISGFASGIVDTIRDKLSIHSPSRVLADEVGKYMAQGIGMGFENEMPSVSMNMAKAIPVSSANYAAEPATVNGNSSGSNNSEVNLSLNIPLSMDGKVVTNVVSKVQFEDGRIRSRGSGAASV